MKAIFLFVGVIMAGCAARDCGEVSVKNHFNALEIQRNDRLLNIVRERGRYSSAGRIKDETDEAIRIGTMHYPYLKSRSRTDLLTCSDSLYNILSRARYRNDSIIGNIVAARTRVETEPDTTAVLNLFFWTITAENIVLEERLSRVSVISDQFFLTLPTFMEKDTFQVGDTVRIAFEYQPEYALSFDRLVCSDESGKHNLRPSLLKVGPSYMMSFIPKHPAAYTLKGTVGIAGDYEYGMLVSNSFTVK